MPHDRDAETVTDIILACHRVQQFAADMDRDAFLEDAKTQSAIIHQLLIIGEAAGRLSASFQSQHPEVPWQQIRGMRNHLVHVYDDIDLDEVWQTVERDVPHLLDHLQKITGH